MISSHNIAAYIQFLYRQKYDSVAPNDLIQSWQNVPAEHIPSELQRLYAHWGMTESESENLTKRFFLEHASTPPHQSQAFTPPPAPQPTQPHYNAAPPYQQPPPAGSSRSNLKPIFLGVLLLIAIGALGYFFLKEDGASASKNDASILADVNTSKNAEGTAPTEELKAQLKEVDSLKSEVKRVKDSLAASLATVSVNANASEDTRERDVSNILYFLYAEESQNINQVLKYYAPNIDRYWDLNKPSIDQISKRYLNLWSKIEDAKHVDIDIQNIGGRTYDVTGTYIYYSIKDRDYRWVPIHTRFVMNESGKIVKTFGVKN